MENPWKNYILRENFHILSFVFPAPKSIIYGKEKSFSLSWVRRGNGNQYDLCLHSHPGTSPSQRRLYNLCFPFCPSNASCIYVKSQAKEATLPASVLPLRCAYGPRNSGNDGLCHAPGRVTCCNSVCLLPHQKHVNSI